MVIALYALGGLAAFSLLMSEMPRMLAWPLAVVAAAEGIRLARAERSRPGHQLVWMAGNAPTLDGRVMAGVQLRWRGPCAFLRCVDPDARVHRLAWWPDTLSGTARRELRLAAVDSAGAAPPASMAP